MRLSIKISLGLTFFVILISGCRKVEDSGYLCEQIKKSVLFSDADTGDWIGGTAEILKNKFYGLEDFPFDSFLQEMDSLSGSKLITEFKRLKDTLSAAQKVKFLTDIVFSIRSVTFDSSSLNIYNLFPHTVWKNRRGACMGTSLLLLIVAQKMELPVYPVLLPGHIFLRYDDGDTAINMEPNRKGYTYSDSVYRVKYHISRDSRYYDLKPLNNAELKAVWLYSIGGIFMNKKAYDRAACIFNISLQLMPGYAEAMGNLGLSYFYLEKDSLTLNILNKAKPLLREDVNINQNLASIYIHMGQHADALDEYREGLAKKPDDPELLLGISKAYIHFDSLSRAEFYLSRLLETNPDLEEAKQMLNTLRK